jgi:hypothetical protein
MREDEVSLQYSARAKADGLSSFTRQIIDEQRAALGRLDGDGVSALHFG